MRASIRRARPTHGERLKPPRLSALALLALVSCTQGPDVAGVYRVEQYRENTLSCDEMGHAGAGPAYLRLVSEFGGRSLQLQRCPTDPETCASAGPLSAVRFFRGDESGWQGEHNSARTSLGACSMRRRVDQLVLGDEGHVHLELRAWASDDPGARACDTDTVEALADEFACERYEVFELAPIDPLP